MLEEFFHSKSKAVVLTRLFTPDFPRCHLRQLARDGGLSAPALLKELKHLHELKLVCRESRNGQTEYFANREAALFPALCDLVERGEGLHGRLRRMLAPLDAACVFIYGSEANGTARPDSDIDLFVIGECTWLDISQALLPAADLTNREINPFLLSPKEFRKRCEAQEHFVRSVLKTPRIFLKGGERELARLGR